MNLTIEKLGSKTTARLSGRLDTVNSAEFEKQMQPLLEGEQPDIELDCEHLEYIASSGLRLFLTLQKSVTARNGRLVLTRLSPDIKAIFDMTRFSSIFRIV